MHLFDARAVRNSYSILKIDEIRMSCCRQTSNAISTQVYRRLDNVYSIVSNKADQKFYRKCDGDRLFGRGLAVTAHD